MGKVMKRFDKVVAVFPASSPMTATSTEPRTTQKEPSMTVKTLLRKRTSTNDLNTLTNLSKTISIPQCQNCIRYQLDGQINYPQLNVRTPKYATVDKLAPVLAVLDVTSQCCQRSTPIPPKQFQSRGTFIVQAQTRKAAPNGNPTRVANKADQHSGYLASTLAKLKARQNPKTKKTNTQTSTSPLAKVRFQP